MQTMEAPHNHSLSETMKKRLLLRYPIRRIVAVVLGVLTAMFLISGFGITEPRLIGLLTLGMLGKTLSYRIHTLLWGPFLIFLVLHLALSCQFLRYKK